MQDGADKGESVTFEDERKKKQTWTSTIAIYQKSESTRLNAIW